MLLLNAPIGLSPVDEFVLRHIPKHAQCGVIVNAGTNRLSNAIKEQLGSSISIYNIEERKPLFDLLENDEFKSADPWDLDWYANTAKKNGGFDFIFFVNIHEVWNGNLLSLQKILNFLKPNGTGFISFYNKNSLYEIRQNIPPFTVGPEQLASPINTWAKLDLASWMIFLADIEFPLNQVWGILEDEAFDYCHKTTKNSVLWKTKGLEIPINDPSDAYILGAPAMCIHFERAKSKTTNIPKFLGVKYNASMLQAILFPYIQLLYNEIDIFNAHLEVKYLHEPEKDSQILLNFFVEQLNDFKNIKKVLLVGCGWGMNLLDLKKIKPNWNITGVDISHEIISIGSEVTKQQGIETIAYGTDGTLPFNDNSFDLIISLNHFSYIYQPLAKELASEMLRVTKQGIAQLEDLRGPDFSMLLKLYSIPDIYTALGYDSEVRSIKIEGKDSGLYILKVKK